MVFSIVKDVDIDVKDIYAQYILDTDRDNLRSYVADYLYANDYNLNSLQFEELVSEVESYATEEEYSNIKSEARVKMLKAMNNYVLDVIGDDEATEEWFSEGVPDNASEEDYLFIAEHDADWEHVVLVFRRCVKQEVNSF